MVSCIIDLLGVCMVVLFYSTVWYLLVPTTTNYYVTTTTTTYWYHQYLPAGTWYNNSTRYLVVVPAGYGTGTNTYLLVVVPVLVWYWYLLTTSTSSLPAVVCTIHGPGTCTLTITFGKQQSMLPKVCRGRSWYRIV